MTNNGWIKLYRKICDNIIWQNEKALKIWIWCLLKANHKGKEVLIGRQKIKIRPGQFVFGSNKATQELNISKSTIHYWISFLISERYIERKIFPKYSIITILNWNKYQGVERKTDDKLDTNETQSSPIKETNKNVKNDNNEKNNIYTPQNPSKQFFKKEKSFNTLLNDFSEALKVPRESLEEEFNHFILYWTEPNKSGSKVRWELERTFDVKRRLYTWLRNKQTWSKENNKGKKITTI